MILAINTAEKLHEMALIDSPAHGKGKILSEHIWQDQKDDVETLVPTLKKLLTEANTDKSQITDILVVRGPGSFTSLRTGVAFANALAHGLDANLYEIDTFVLLFQKAASKDPILVVLNAGGLDVAIQTFNGSNATIKDSKPKEAQIGPIATLLHGYTHEKYQMVSSVNETQSDELNSVCLEKKWKQIKGHEMQTFAECVLTYGLPVKKVKLVDPYYLKSPHITKSSNPWKQ